MHRYMLCIIIKYDQEEMQEIQFNTHTLIHYKEQYYEVQISL